jgi:hypothetical protein
MIHQWFGALFRYGVDQMVAQIDIDPAVRPPRHNGSRDAEVLLQGGPSLAALAVAVFVDRCAEIVQAVLADLPAIKRYGLDHAPAEWVKHYASQPGATLLDRLFLETLDLDRQLRLTVLFDFGDLDLLAVRLDEHEHEHGHCTGITIER